MFIFELRGCGFASQSSHFTINSKQLQENGFLLTHQSRYYHDKLAFSCQFHPEHVKIIFSVIPGDFLVLTALLANARDNQNFHIQRVFFYLQMLQLVINMFGNISSTVTLTVHIFIVPHTLYIRKGLTLIVTQVLH